ncbi:MAG TPA: hypothetical protein VJ784_00030 [Pyrinomonadaceae bacterium]|nr:hypothetical protein [Pyrinomonadaceae bacterium]
MIRVGDDFYLIASRLGRVEVGRVVVHSLSGSTCVRPDCSSTTRKVINDWPVIGVDPDGDRKGEPVSRYRKPDVGREYPIQVPQTSDEFIQHKLGLQWQWHANPMDDWLSLSTRRGWLRLKAVSRPAGAANLWVVPNLLLQKLPARDFTVTTLIDASHLQPGERSGLLMMGRNYSYLAVEKTSAGVRIVRVICIDAPKGAAEKEVVEGLKSQLVYLKVSVFGEAICNFSFGTDGKRFRWLCPKSRYTCSSLCSLCALCASVVKIA